MKVKRGRPIMGDNKVCKIQYCLAKLGIELSEVVKNYMVSLVPSGRLTRDRDMLEYLSKVFNVSWAEFKRDQRFIIPLITNSAVYDDVPNHRVVSDRGIAYPLTEDKLRSEGHKLIQTKITKYGLQVKDYKKYLFDFEKEANINIDELKALCQEGLIFKNN